jgi:hypothetical protein
VPLTIEEITQREEGLSREIGLMQRLLDAYTAVRADMEHGPIQPALAANLSAPVSAGNPTPGNSAATLLLANASLPAAVPPASRTMNPELEALSTSYGGTGRVVSRAIERLNGEFTLRDIAAVLARENWTTRGAEISVVLSRLKRRGEIEEIQFGCGRRPTVYRKRASAAHQEQEATDPARDTESRTESAGEKQEETVSLARPADAIA